MFAGLKSFFCRNETLNPINVSNVEEHNSTYKLGADLIGPQMMLHGRHLKITNKGKRDIQKGIHCLQAVTVFNPANWNAFWIMGKGYQAMGEHRQAYQNFKKAYEIEHINPNVPREFAESCMQLGYGPEAVTIAIGAVEAAPNDAGLHANLALAYLISNENSYAQKSIQYALDLDPEDQISQRLQKFINEVIAGKRVQPKNLSDLQG